MSLAPSNYADLAGRSLRLALNCIREVPGCLDCHDVRRALVALAGAADTQQVPNGAFQSAFRKMRRAGAADYERRVGDVVAAVRAWRRLQGIDA